MMAIVYRCRRAGELLDTQEIRADPVHGNLRVQRKGMKRIAVLLRADGASYLLPVLDKVKILDLNDAGVLLAGIEVYPPRGAKGNGPIHRQTWWCVLRGSPAPLQGTPAEARERERRRQAAEIGRTMVNHYGRRS